MSCEIMAECLEEATNLLAEMFPERPESLEPIVAIAVALYRERMRASAIAPHLPEIYSTTWTGHQ